jgi:hypothetical protein
MEIDNTKYQDSEEDSSILSPISSIDLNLSVYSLLGKFVSLISLVESYQYQKYLSSLTDWEFRAKTTENQLLELAEETRRLFNLWPSLYREIELSGSSSGGGGGKLIDEFRLEKRSSSRNALRRSNSTQVKQNSEKGGQVGDLSLTSLEYGEKPRHTLRMSKNNPIIEILRRESDVTDEISPVVLQNNKAKVNVDVEVPLHSKVQCYEITVKPDIYDKEFFARPHWNWAATFKNKPNEVFIISVLKDSTGGYHKAVKNTMSGFVEFTITESSKSKQKRSKSAVEKKLQENWPNIRFYELSDSAVSADIRDIEKNFPQSFDAFDITLLEVNEGQTDPHEIFQNKEHSPQFEKFLRVMSISLPLTEKTEFEWNEKKIRWFLASQMNEEQIRRLIGNTENVVLFHNASIPFDPIHIDKMGNIPQTFIVVQPFKKSTYRIGSFHRFDLSYPPFVPTNYAFGTIDVKEFILTKIYNGLMKSRNCPPYCSMYERPRLRAIREIVEKYVSNKGQAHIFKG